MSLFSMLCCVALTLSQQQGEGYAPASYTVPETRVVVRHVRLSIEVREKAYSLEAKIYQPDGPGPFPVVVINHGTPADKKKLPGIKPGFTRAAHWFVRRGFLVVTALRPGFGTSDGPYLEGAGPCRDENYVEAGIRTGAIEAEIVRASQRLPDADPSRVIVVGQSAGGLGAVALGSVPPPGVLGIISFAGGRGGDGKGHICASEDRLVDAEQVFGQGNRLPQLWLYAANDRFFRSELAHRMASAFRTASPSGLEFVDLPAFDDDGHKTFGLADPAVWSSFVARFLVGVLSPR